MRGVRWTLCEDCTSRASVYWPEDKAMEEGKWQVVGITLSSAAEDFIVTPI